MNINTLFQKIVRHCGEQNINYTGNILEAPRDRDLVSIYDCLFLTVNDIYRSKEFQGQVRTIFLGSENFKEHRTIKGESTTDIYATDFTPDYTVFNLNRGGDYNRLISYAPVYQDDLYTVANLVTNPTQWNYLNEYGYTYNRRFRINQFQKTIDIQEPMYFTNENGIPTPSDSIQLSYISNSWLYRIGDNGEDVFAYELGDHDDWEVVIDSENKGDLVFNGTVALWRERFSTEPAMSYRKDYESQLNLASSRSKPAQPLQQGSDYITSMDYREFIGGSRKDHVDEAYDALGNRIAFPRR